MKKVLLKYNPFLVETVITINDKPISPNGELASKCGMRLQSWLDILFPLLDKECNDDIILKFRGTELDFNDVRAVMQDYRRKSKMTIELDQPELVEGGTVRLKKVIGLFDELQKNCPFEDLKAPEIRKEFNRAISTQFEISVIATMSSGKSTLINAMLERELAPSKAAACTATIAHIQDVKGRKDFSAECYGENGRLVIKTDNLTPQKMALYNENAEITDIYIEGNIPFSNNDNMQLVLVDTPGPNNSRTTEHEKRTYRVIKSDSMPMVIYVMNATQLFINDDKYLLEAVAKSVKEHHGKQARDRFIFVINKTDTLDPDKGEKPKLVVRDAKEYLADLGIKDANIYPISAEFSKIIRLKQSGQELTRTQERLYRDCDYVFEPQEMHLEKLAPLSPSVRNKIETDLQIARSKGDIQAEALIHTGVPALETAIVEYMNKYTLTNKIKEAVETFKRKIDEKNLIAQLEQEWLANDAKRQEMTRQLQELSRQLEQGKKAQSFSERIKALDISKDLIQKIRAIRVKLDAGFDEYYSGAGTQGTISPEDAQRILNHMRELVPKLQADIQTDLERVIDTSLVASAQQILAEYQAQIKNFVQGSALRSSKDFFNLSANILTVNMPDVGSVVRQFTETKIEYTNVSVKVGEKTVSDSKWYNPFSWFKSHKEPIYETRRIGNEYKIVNFDEAMENYFQPLRQNMGDNIIKIQETAKAQAEEFKKYFIGELQKLDSAMQQKIKMLEKAGRNKEQLEAKIKADAAKKQWLENFRRELDTILTV